MVALLPGLANNRGVDVFVGSESVVRREACVLPPGTAWEAPSNNASGRSSVEGMGLRNDSGVERDSGRGKR